MSWCYHIMIELSRWAMRYHTSVIRYKYVIFNRSWLDSILRNIYSVEKVSTAHNQWDLFFFQAVSAYMSVVFYDRSRFEGCDGESAINRMNRYLFSDDHNWDHPDNGIETHNWLKRRMNASLSPLNMYWCKSSWMDDHCAKISIQGLSTSKHIVATLTTMFLVSRGTSSFSTGYRGIDSRFCSILRR